MLRVISEVKPTYVVGENVRGLTNWSGGLVFEEVCTDLEAQGYTVQPILLPACAVGAPHRRDRVWFVAYSNGCRGDRKAQHENSNKDCGNGQQSDNLNNDGKIRGTTTNSNSRGLERTKEIGWDSVNVIGEGEFRTATNTNSIRQHKRECDNEEFASERGINALNDVNPNDGSETSSNTESQRTWKQPSENARWKDRRFNNDDEIRNASDSQCNGGAKDNRLRKSRFNDENSQRNDWQDFPTQSPICGGDDGLPTELDGITFSKWRNESIKGYGNAIVPQVAYQIFKVIAEMDAREKAQLKLF